MPRISASDLLGFHTGLSRKDWAWCLLPISAALLLSYFPVFSGDIWMHLASAKLILQTGQVPHKDVFLYTARGRPWVDHSWGAQILFYGAYCAGNVNGLVAMRMLLVAGAALLFWLLAIVRGAKSWIAALCAAGLVGIGAPYFITRPLLFALICAAGMLLLLARPTWARVGCAMAIQLAWANLHASFLLGIAITGCAAIDASARQLARRFRSPAATAAAPGMNREHDLEHRPLRLWAATIAAFLISLCNPNGPGLYRYVYDLHQLTWVRELIEEWRPPQLWQVHNQYFALAVAVTWIAIVACIVRKRNFFIADLLLLAIFSVQAFSSRRFILQWSFLAVAPLSLAISQIIPNRRRMHLLVGIMLAGLTLFLLLDNIGIKLRRGELRAGLNERILPVAAVEFMRENGLFGNISCSQYAGGFLTWSDKRFKPATDGRCLVNSPETIAAFNALARGSRGWKGIFPAPDVSDIVLIENGYHHTPTYTMHKTWAIVYWDDKWEIWLRRGSRHRDIIKQYDTTLASPNMLQHVYESLPPADRLRIRRKLEKRINRRATGTAFALLGYTHYVEGIMLLGKAAEQEDLLNQAVRRNDTKVALAAKTKAVSLERQGGREIALSIELFDRDLDLNPDANRSIYAKARSLVWLAQTERAGHLFREAAKSDPMNWVYAVNSVGYAANSLEVLFGRDAREAVRARKLYQQLQGLARADRKRIGQRFAAMGRSDEIPSWLE